MRRSCRRNDLSLTILLTISDCREQTLHRLLTIQPRSLLSKIDNRYGVGLARGERVGASIGLPDGLPIGNANVGDGDRPGLAEMTGDGETVGLAAVGGGGLIFSQ